MECEFGTDGVRGIAGTELTREFAARLGWAVAAFLDEQGLPKRVVIGRDTRASGPELLAGFSAGLATQGVTLTDMGIVPTGAVSFAAKSGGFGLGVVVSASHNPPEYNGIKLFAGDGSKLDPVHEKWISQRFLQAPQGGDGALAVSTPEDGSSHVQAYVEFLKEIAPSGLSGLTVVLDAANGAAYEIAPRVFEELGAKVVPFATEPDGQNINVKCGATATQTMQALTKRNGAHFGVAFDGDADRAVFADAEGRLVNGDQTIALWCAPRAAKGALPKPSKVIVTVMTNSGFVEHMQSLGFQVERVDVGDRNVSKAIQEQDALIGGEQSGHVIFPHRGPTGDGLVTALEIANVVTTSGRPLHELWVPYVLWPQVLLNFSCANPNCWKSNDNLKSEFEYCKQMLDTGGRINIRKSGTEPILRVMIEAPDAAALENVSSRLEQALARELTARLIKRVNLCDALGN